MKTIEFNTTPNQLRLAPAAWMKLTGIEVIDPDGWDRSSKTDWDKPITLPLFLHKAAMSTTRRWPNGADEAAIILATMERVEALLA